jgi:hypothetical protein
VPPQSTQSRIGLVASLQLIWRHQQYRNEHRDCCGYCFGCDIVKRARRFRQGSWRWNGTANDLWTPPPLCEAYPPCSECVLQKKLAPNVCRGCVACCPIPNHAMCMPVRVAQLGEARYPSRATHDTSTHSIPNVKRSITRWQVVWRAALHSHSPLIARYAHLQIDAALCKEICTEARGYMEAAAIMWASSVRSRTARAVVTAQRCHGGRCGSLQGRFVHPASS